MYLQNLELRNQKVLVRVDFNVPLDEDFQVSDDTRIQAALPTIQHILSVGGAVILMSHLGRPQKKLKADGSIDRDRFSLRHLVGHLSKVLGQEVQFVEDTIGEEVEALARNLKAGSVLLLENTRFYEEEKKGDRLFAQALANLADVYVNDAFGTVHRSHASTCTVAEYFEYNKKGLGFLIMKELEEAQKLNNNPQRPFTAIVGGAKVSDKILLLEKLLDNVDNILVGGGMAYTFWKAKGGQIGNSLVELKHLDAANTILNKAIEKGVNIVLPTDSVVADAFDNNANIQQRKSDAIEDGWMGLDIGKEAQTTFSQLVAEAKTIFWNGPMGVFELSNFAKGTEKIAEALVEATEKGAFSVVGGGDSVSAINKLGKASAISHISTGGGVVLKLLEQSVLPGIEAIKSK